MKVSNAFQSAMDLAISPSLQAAIADAHPLYVLPKDSVTEEVLIPALKSTKSLDVMMGYFSSASFAEIAPGLATFLRSTRAPMRMIISPFVTDDDFAVLTEDRGRFERLAKRILIDNVPHEDAIVRHTLECLAWLISAGRLILKIAVIRKALFHPKVWLFDDGRSHVALHGSTNLTETGLSRNREQLTLSRDWKGEEAVFHNQRLRQEFGDLWSGRDEYCRTLPLTEAISRNVIERYKTAVIPDEGTLTEIWEKSRRGDIGTPAGRLSEPVRLSVPSWISYETGDFAHQGNAVTRWERADRRGILEMATGAGKTITAMICATRLQDEIGSVLVVVSAPYRPLIEQWCDEIREFGIRPINLSEVGGPQSRYRAIKQAGRRLRMKYAYAEILVVSNDTLSTQQLHLSLSQIDIPQLLIADECHTLGARSFISNPPRHFNYRLGLSATPVRQYDEHGTAALVEYFGEICFTFDLEAAIGNCLTEYDYHVHFAALTDEEMARWLELTDKIKRHAWKLASDKSDPYLDNLLRQRRLVLETSVEKLDILENLLAAENARTIRFTLIYASDKDPEQLIAVNQLLNDHGVLFHQLTQEETQNRKKTVEILSEFQNGVTQVLTAKRVLDEGVNIPQIKRAYILASTTVQRQWVQRRGRLLRKCSAIEKTHAEIHDFVVLPPGLSSSDTGELDRDVRRLVRSELDRVWEFARLSRNGPDMGGPYEAVERLQGMANERLLN